MVFFITFIQQVNKLQDSGCIVCPKTEILLLMFLASLPGSLHGCCCVHSLLAWTETISKSWFLQLHISFVNFLGGGISITILFLVAPNDCTHFMTCVMYILCLRSDSDSNLSGFHDPHTFLSDQTLLFIQLAATSATN